MTQPRRGGFTLVELLLVVSILAVLAALGVAAFLIVKKSETTKASEATVEKLNMGLDAKWKAVLDDARDDLKAGRLDVLVTWAGNDKDRALAVWSYLKLKNEFPTSLQEAANPVVLTDTTSGQVAFLPPKAIFRSLLKVGGSPLPNTATSIRAVATTQSTDESGVLFQWGITASAVRGMAFGQDGTANQTGEIDAPISYQFAGPGGSPSAFTGKAFKDALGVPIAFVRLAYAGEVNGPPYARPSAPVGTGTVKVIPNDPLDPKGTLPTLVTWSGSGPEPAWHQGKLLAFWTAATSGHIGYDWVLPNPPGGANTFPNGVTWGYPFDVQTSGTTTTLKPFNVVPTLIAAGEDKKFATNIGGGDDLIGFRLRREGNRGN